ncbi:MAG: extracellular solute-binding protein [Clostridiales bacterium]|nr:extracellular solute-binding protein [Clostridiales bacterium]
MRSTKRLTAGLLSTVMIAGVLAGCSSSESEESKKKTSTEIPTEFTEDSDWYNMTQVDVSQGYDPNRYEFLDYSFVGMYDGGYVVNTTGWLKAPDTATSDQAQVSNIDYFSSEGELITSVNLSDKIDALDYYFNASTISGDKVIVNYTAYSETSSDYYQMTVDLNTGDCSEPEKIANPDNTGDESSFENRFELGTVSVETYWQNYNDQYYSYSLEVYDEDGTSTTIDLHELFPNESIFDISNALYVDEDTVLLMGNIGGSGEDSSIYLVLDVNSKDVTIGDPAEYSWLNEYPLWNTTTIAGKGTYFIPNEANGICRIDFENKTIETVIDFNCCNVNRFDLMNLNIVDVTDEGVILAGNKMDKEGFAIFKFMKADSNPNAGKTVLKAASLTGLSYSICEAIYRFNDTSDSYFIAIDDRYNTFENTSSISGGYSEDYNEANLQSQAEIGDQMAVDIMAGDGPDILFNGASLTQLNNTDYLVDLTDLVSDDSEYFTNITDALKFDDKVFQVPVTFELTGIITSAQYVEDGQVGFTFDQYVDFVDRVCNGADPIGYSQIEYFSLCYAAMSPLFYDGSSVNFKTDDFTALAEYIKNHVKNKPDTAEMDPELAIDYMGGSENSNARFGAIYSLSSFLWETDNDFENTRILGIPSSDGRGPAFDISLSVAVSSQSKHTDACIDFVKMMLSEDFQEFAGSSNYSNPISRTAFRSIAENDLESYNEEVEWNLSYFSARELEDYGLPSKPVNSDVIDYYESILNSSVSPTVTDASIALIMREEIQAYFVGQRDLSTVADTMTNRVTTYINERG